LFPAPPGGGGPFRQADEAEIRIGDVVVGMVRKNNLDIPAEFSAYIPRAEIRRRFQDGQLAEEEIILSSITIVHSPRHRTEKSRGHAPARAGASAWGDATVTPAQRVVPRLHIRTTQSGT